VDSAQNTALRASVGKLQVALTYQSSAFLRVAEQTLGRQVGAKKQFRDTGRRVERCACEGTSSV